MTRFIWHIEEDGSVTVLVKLPDGSERPATEEEQAEHDRQCQQQWADLRQKTRDAWEFITRSPDYRLPLTARHLRYHAWKTGRAPHHRPSYGELLLLRAEDERERLQQGTTSTILRADLVTMAEVAKLVHLAKSTMKGYSPKWPKPKIQHRGRCPAKWSYQTLRPTLVKQFPNADLPETLPESQK